MRTEFTAEQLADPVTAASAGIIRKCVHCGFCTATCPTYVLLGDELDSPRGRIYLIKDMLERDATPSPEVVRHIDRCLSCLACVTTCPSGVDYMHLIDHARAYVEARYRRPVADRAVRALLAAVMPHRGRFRIAMRLARLGRFSAPVLRRIPALRRVAAMLDLVPPAPSPRSRRGPAGSATAAGTAPGIAPVRRVALLLGCVEPELRPDLRDAALRVLDRAGIAVVPVPGEGCCGALTHHLGREEAAKAMVRRNVSAWTRVMERDGLDAILTTVSGCGTMLKDYGHVLRDDPVWAERAAAVSAKARDIGEFLFGLDLPLRAPEPLAIAYHAACSLQHGQKASGPPAALLARAGFAVRTPADPHLCCGSAGTYNIMQPELAEQLGVRKAATLDRLAPDAIAAGNLGCMVQIGRRTGTPVLHVVELLDWAAGGPRPARLPPPRS